MQDTTEQQANESKAVEAIEAIYENGVFRPLDQVDGALVEGQHVKLTLQPLSAGESSLKLLEDFYEGLSEEDIQEIEKVMLDRSNWRSEPLDENAF